MAQAETSQHARTAGCQDCHDYSQSLQVVNHLKYHLNEKRNWQLKSRRLSQDWSLGSSDQRCLLASFMDTLAQPFFWLYEHYHIDWHLYIWSATVFVLTVSLIDSDLLFHPRVLLASPWLTWSVGCLKGTCLLWRELELGIETLWHVSRVPLYAGEMFWWS